MPAREVTRALKDKSISLDRNQIQISSSKILQSLMELKMASDKPDEAAPSKTYFPRISTACNFAQFLCEYRRGQDGEENEDPAESTEEKGAHSEAEIQKMLALLIKSLGAVLSSFHNPSPDAEEDDFFTADAETAFDARQVKVFGFGCLLHLSHYVQEQPTLLPVVWKNLGVLAESMDSLPTELWISAFNALTDILTEGVNGLLEYLCHRASELTASGQSPPLPGRQLKLFSYVLGRIVYFSKVPVCADGLVRTSTLTLLVSRLAVLLGLTCATDEDDSTSHQKKDVGDFFGSLSEKTRRTVGALLKMGKPVTENTQVNPAVHAISLCDKDTIAKSCEDGFSRRTFRAASYGKVLLQLQILTELPSIDAQNLGEGGREGLLQTCEDLIFVSLPRALCKIDSGGPSFQDLVSKTVAGVADAFALIGHANAVSSDDAANAQQRFYFLLISWIHQCAGSRCHPISREVLHTSIRGFIAAGDDHGDFLGLVIELLFDPRTDGFLRRSLVPFALQVLPALPATAKQKWGCVMGECVNDIFSSKQTTSRKRKRDDQMTLRPQDVAIVHPMIKLTEAIALATANDHAGSMRTSVEALIATDFNQLLRHADDFVDLAMTRQEYGKAIESLGSGIVQALHNACLSENDSFSNEAIHSIARFLDVCTSDRSTALLSTKATGILAAVGGVLPQNLSRSILEQLGQIFRRNLDKDVWPLRALTISSFVLFAPKVPSGLKDALPPCLPKHLQKIFHSRLRGSRLIGEDTRRELTERHQEDMSTLVRQSREQGSVFPSRTSMRLVEGSYLLQMPSQDGRHAIVVFPPRAEALEDIEMMLSGHEDERPTVYRIRKVVCTGNGCKLSLSA